MKTTDIPSQRAQSQSGAAHQLLQSVKFSERLAFSPREFAAALGRSPTFAYRQIYAGRVRPISDAGRLLIPRSEIDRFLGRTAEYNPRKKAGSKLKVGSGQS